MAMAQRSSSAEKRICGRLRASEDTTNQGAYFLPAGRLGAFEGLRKGLIAFEEAIRQGTGTMAVLSCADGASCGHNPSAAPIMGVRAHPLCIILSRLSYPVKLLQKDWVRHVKYEV